jgi:hypothetical protein
VPRHWEGVKGVEEDNLSIPPKAEIASTASKWDEEAEVRQGRAGLAHGVWSGHAPPHG